MGINRACVRLLLNEARRCPFEGSLLELGKQDIYFTQEKLKKLAEMHKVKLKNLNKTKTSKEEDFKEIKYIDDVFLFKALGFNDIESIDNSGYESADIILDLNKPVPKELHGKYDTIIDGGTLEHIFHLPNVLKNIHDMLKVGGRIIHIVPSASFYFIDHGLYMFSPTLFNDYYMSNKYSIEKSYVLTFDKFRMSEGFHNVYQYDRTLIEYLTRSNGNSAGIFFVATKNKESTSDVIPQQGMYVEKWSREQQVNEPEFNHYKDAKKSYLYRVIKNIDMKLSNLPFYRGGIIDKIKRGIYDFLFLKKPKPLFRY